MNVVKDPTKVLLKILYKISPLIKNDELYIRMEYFLCRKRLLNLKNPSRFNEKLQWLKLNCKKDVYAKLVDKYEVKQVVASKIGEQFIIPTLGIWDKFEDIDFGRLPNQFVLKCTHDSGGLVICTDKAKLNINEAKKKINKCLKRRYFYDHREYPYKDVQPRIIAEKYLADETGWQLKDYKVFCFNGEPKFIEVDYDRYVSHKLNVYDLNWNFIDFYMTSPNDSKVNIKRPECLDELIGLARKLSQDDIFVRVDFYSINDKIYFGELTYHPGAGNIDFHPDEYDYKLGEMLKLPKH